MYYLIIQVLPPQPSPSSIFLLFFDLFGTSVATVHRMHFLFHTHDPVTLHLSVYMESPSHVLYATMLVHLNVCTPVLNFGKTKTHRD